MCCLRVVMSRFISLSSSIARINNSVELHFRMAAGAVLRTSTRCIASVSLCWSHICSL